MNVCIIVMRIMFWFQGFGATVHIHTAETVSWVDDPGGAGVMFNFTSIRPFVSSAFLLRPRLCRDFSVR